MVAIIVPSEDYIEKWASENNREPILIELASDKDFYKSITIIMDKINNNLSFIEKVRKFIIAKEQFTVENGMLTPTMKIRRFQITRNYEEELKSLY